MFLKPGQKPGFYVTGIAEILLLEYTISQVF